MASKRGSKKEEASIERDDLLELIDEINAVFKPEKPLKAGRKDTEEELIEMIKEEVNESGVYEIDFEPDPKDKSVVVFSEKAKELFEKLEIEILPGSPNDEPAEEAKDEKSTKEEKGGKAKGKEKEPAKEEKGKGKDEKKSGKDEKKKPAAKKKEKKYTRDMAVHAAIEELCKKKGGVDFKTIMDRSDEIYVENGGTSVPDAVNVNKYSLNALVAFEVLELKDGKYSFPK